METPYKFPVPALPRHFAYTTLTLLALGLLTSPAHAAQDDLYVGLSVLSSMLEPDTSNSTYRITEDTDTGYKVFLGYDLRNFFGLEASYSELGEAALTGPTTGVIEYNNWNVSGLLYFPFSSTGPRMFVKAGFGDIDVDSNNIPYTEEEGHQTTAGIGLDWPLRSGYSVRAEYDFFDKDAQSISLGIKKRFSLGGAASRLSGSDLDGDGIMDADDHCPGTAAGVTVLANGCKESRPTPVLALPIDSDGDGIQDSSDTCPDTVKGLMVNLSGCPADSDGDGVVDVIDQCANTPAGISVGGNGCPPVMAAPEPMITDNDADGVGDHLDECLNTAPNITVDSRGCGTSTPVRTGVLDGVNFMTGSILLTEKAKQILDGVAASLNQEPDSLVMIVGHTDSVGGANFNIDLSKNRARAVAGYLVQNGVSAGRLRYIGKGEEMPISTNDSESGRAMNRRVVVIVSFK